jgi:small subunit ribosomal protein S17
MAEDEKNVNDEETPAPDEAAAEAAPVADAPAATDDAAADAPAPADDAPAEAPAPAAAAAAAPAEPQEHVPPKERRKRSRSTHTGEANKPRTLEERLEERAEGRRTKAKHRRAYRAKQREARRAAGPGTPPPAPEPKGTGSAKTRQGIVVSDKGDKTIIVRIDVARRHRTYKKIVRSSSTLHAHDEGNEANAGDTVRVIESRPLSRTKRWRLVEILEKAR